MSGKQSEASLITKPPFSSIWSVRWRQLTADAINAISSAVTILLPRDVRARNAFIFLSP
jgi:hypothetical protein